MSPAIPGDGWGRSGSGETQARPEATGLMTEIYALVHYLNEKSFFQLGLIFPANGRIPCPVFLGSIVDGNLSL